MDNNMFLLIALPVFIIFLVFAVYYLVIKDTDKVLEDYEKKTGKKIKVKPMEYNSNFAKTIDSFSNTLDEKLTLVPPSAKKAHKKELKLQRKQAKKQAKESKKEA